MFQLPVLADLNGEIVSISPVPGLAATNVQGALVELAARPTSGGGGEGATLPNASATPASPAIVEFDLADPNASMGPWNNELVVKIGQTDFGQPGTYQVFSEPEETYGAFFARLVGMEMTDASGQHALTVTVTGAHVRFSSTVGFMLQSMVVNMVGFPGDVVAAPIVARSYDTRDENVRRGNEPLSVALDRIESRPGRPNPLAIIRGARDLSSFPNLPANGATVGDQITVQYLVDGQQRGEGLTIGPTTTIVDFYDFVRNSTILNPNGVAEDGDGSEIVATYDFGGTKGLLVFSRSGYPVSIWSGYPQTAQSILGSLPA